MRIIYKVVSRSLWEQATDAGVFTGAAIDLADGYIHFSTAAQVVETVRKHFAGQDDLVLVSVDADALGESLRWEVSRGGAAFPHLYADLPLDTVIKVDPLPIRDDGNHRFPPL
jgi:uncharacterized protein (DUF952 family)